MPASLFKSVLVVFCCLWVTGGCFAQDSSQAVYYRPDFYSRVSRVVLDTTFTYECYDARDSIVNADTMVNFEYVKYISLFKRYFDHSHNYKDNGIEKPIPLSKIVCRYDKTAKTRWMMIDYARKSKMSEVAEHKDKIVREEAVDVTDNKTGAKSTRTYKYYETIITDF